MRRKVPQNELVRMLSVEYRTPRNNEEKRLYGQTKWHGENVAYVYINNRKVRSGEAMNTFFHEMTHVWLNLFSDKRFSNDKEEDLARQIGAAAEGIITLR